eukprot:gene16906-20104_t
MFYKLKKLFRSGGAQQKSNDAATVNCQTSLAPLFNKGSVNAQMTVVQSNGVTAFVQNKLFDYMGQYLTNVSINVQA